MKYAMISILALSGCGFSGTEHVAIDNATQTIAINFGFLDQLQKLCEAQLLQSDYKSKELYNQAVANCVFSNLSLLNVAQLQNLQNTYCKPGADLTSFTPAQIDTIKSSCAAIQQPIGTP